MKLPHVLDCEDGSILIEWISKEKRFGISIEKEIDESGWYFVSKDGTAECMILPKEMTECLKKYFE